MSHTPKASVIIPAWNAAAFVERAIRSALQQTCRDLEVIVVNDGSTDGTSDVVDAIARTDARVRQICSVKPSGPSNARNLAIAAASGEWLAPLDADDWMDAARVELLIEEASARRLDFIADNLWLVDFADGVPFGLALDPDLMAHSGPIGLNTLLKADWPGRTLQYRGIGFAKPIIRSEFLRQKKLFYRKEIRLAEDFLLYGEALILGAQFGLTSKSLYYYSVRDGSESDRKSPTREMVDVNSILMGLATEYGKDNGEAVDLLKSRGQALEFQVFAWALKSGRLAMARTSAAQLGVGPLLTAGLKAGGRLARRRAARSNKTTANPFQKFDHDGA